MIAAFQTLRRNGRRKRFWWDSRCRKPQHARVACEVLQFFVFLFVVEVNKARPSLRDPFSAPRLLGSWSAQVVWSWCDRASLDLGRLYQQGRRWDFPYRMLQLPLYSSRHSFVAAGITAHVTAPTTLLLPSQLRYRQHHCSCYFLLQLPLQLRCGSVTAAPLQLRHSSGCSSVKASAEVCLYLCVTAQNVRLTVEDPRNLVTPKYPRPDHCTINADSFSHRAWLRLPTAGCQETELASMRCLSQVRLVVASFASAQSVPFTE